MILLTNTVSGTDTITVTNTTASSTLQIHASYVDWDGSSTFTPGRKNSSVVSNTTTTAVNYPAINSYRTVKFLSIYNSYTTAVVVVVSLYTTYSGDSGAQLISITLPKGYTLVYSDNSGWATLDQAGHTVQTTAGSSGRLQRYAALTSGTSYTVGPGTNTIRVFMWGGGNSGGTTTSVASAAGASGGGGSGGYAEWVVAVTPSTSYTYAIGAAGGGSTTFVVGATTVTAKGGSAGAAGTGTTTVTTKAGGAGAAVSTNGTVNGAGAPGGYGMVPAVNSGTTEIVSGGRGGSTNVGGGGVGKITASAGAAGTGYGAGGSGGTCGASTANSGGVGTAGLIIVEEYS